MGGIRVSFNFGTNFGFGISCGRVFCHFLNFGPELFLGCVVVLDFWSVLELTRLLRRDSSWMRRVVRRRCAEIIIVRDIVRKISKVRMMPIIMLERV